MYLRKNMNKQNNEKDAKKTIQFYCKDCKQIVDTRRIGQKYVYICQKCGTKNVAFGTEKSLATFYRIESLPEERA